VLDRCLPVGDSWLPFAPDCAWPLPRPVLAVDLGFRSPTPGLLRLRLVRGRYRHLDKELRHPGYVLFLIGHRVLAYGMCQQH